MSCKPYTIIKVLYPGQKWLKFGFGSKDRIQEFSCKFIPHGIRAYRIITNYSGKLLIILVGMYLIESSLINKRVRNLHNSLYIFRCRNIGMLSHLVSFSTVRCTVYIVHCTLYSNRQCNITQCTRSTLYNV